MRRALDAESELYRAYRREVEGEGMARSARSGAAIVLALNTGFVPLDWFAFRADFAGMLAARIACNAAMALVWLFGARRWPVAAAAGGCIAVGGMLLAVIQAAGGVTGPYSPGLMLLFLGMPVLLPFSAAQAARIAGALLLALAALPLLGGELPAASAYAFHLIFPAAAAVESAFACAVLDGLRFRDFERRRALERLDEEKSRFTANVHHELRTPLTLMLAPLEAMLTGDFGAVPELVRGYLATMHANGLRLLKLINNLLDLAKLESGRLGIARRRLHPGPAIEALVAAARPLAERKGVALATRGLAELPEVCCDPDALEKVVVNLVGNALKFTEPGGRIEVSGEARAQGGVRIAVVDSGCGIPPTELERIFDRFAQVDASSTRRHEGTGIGLSLVRELVLLHGGSIRAESEGLGRGTRMLVELPAGEPDAAEAVEALDGALAGPGGMAALEAELALDPERARLVELEHYVGRRAAAREPVAGPEGLPDAPEILVCEDNPEMRRLLVQLLAREFRVHAARDGREGLERVRSRAPAVVLTDVMMPEMSGTELCRALKADPATAGIPVVLVTSKAEREMRIEGLEQGADDYVTKPFHPRELLARVRALARLRGLQEEAAVRSRDLERANAELEAALAELRETGLRLAQSERLAAVGELAAGIAHEANNPVNFAINAVRELTRQVGDLRRFAEAAAALGGGADAAAELAKLRAEARLDEAADALVELASIASEGLERTQRLVGDLRDFATPGGGARGPVDLRRGLLSTAQLLGYALREARIELRLELEPDLPSVEGDARALNQVFLNLLKNAVEALEGRGGTIWVAGRREGDAVRIEVRDDGPGIAPEALARVFEPFHTTKAAGRGTGLGLALSRRIAGEHGGSLEAGPAAEGGACFVLRLPVGGGARAA